MPAWSDLLVLLAIGVSTGYWVRLIRRRGALGAGFAVASAVAFLGLVLIVTMTAHCLDVLSRLAIGAAYDGSAFGYNFPLGTVLVLVTPLIPIQGFFAIPLSVRWCVAPSGALARPAGWTRSAV